jgi:uncharacterized protein (TIGR02147 family)
MSQSAKGIAPSAQILRDAYLVKKERNPSYSTRAFARDLGISQSLVSLILHGKRNVTLKQALKFAEVLEIDGATAESLIKSAAIASARDRTARQYLEARLEAKRTSAPDDETVSIQVDRFRVISQWYHLPILDLISTKDFIADARFVAERLGITELQANDAIERLIRLGLLEIKDGKWAKTHAKIFVPTDRSHEAVRGFHRQMIGKALDELQDTSVEAFSEREISGTTMSIDPARLPELKKTLARLQRKFSDIATKGEASQVYQLNIQFFNLTKMKRKTP